MTTWDTFNPSDTNDGVLSAGNTHFVVNGGTSNGYSRATSNQSNAGKWYFEFQMFIPSLEFGAGMGLATLGASFTDMSSSAGLNTFQIKPYGFGDAMALDGAIVYQNALGSYPQTCGIAVDFGAKLGWIRSRIGTAYNNNGSANPATGVGGLDLTALMAKGLLYPYVNSQGDVSNSYNFFADPASFQGTPPGGFTNGWPMHTVTPPSTKRNRGLVIT